MRFPFRHWFPLRIRSNPVARRRLFLEELDERKLPSVVNPPAVVNLSLSAMHQRLVNSSPYTFQQFNVLSTGLLEGETVTITATTETPVVGDQQVNISAQLELVYPNLENDRPAGYLPGPQPTVGAFTLSNGGVITILDGQTSGSITLTTIDDSVFQIRQRGAVSIASVSPGLSPGSITTGSFDVRDSVSMSDDDLIFMRNWAYWTNGAAAFAWPVNGSATTADNPVPGNLNDINWNGINATPIAPPTPYDSVRLGTAMVTFGTLKPADGLLLPPGAEKLTGMLRFDLRHAGGGTTGTGFPISQIAGFGQLNQIQRIRFDNTKLDGQLVDAFPTLEDFDNLNLFNMTSTGVSGPIPSFPNPFASNFANLGMSGPISSPFNLSSPVIRLDLNRLSGDVPLSLLGLNFSLSGNQLTGNPFGIAPSPFAPNGLRYNAIVGLEDGTQTVAPTGIQATAAATPGSVTLSWTPILYTADTGYYEVFSAQTSGGPYISRGKTTDKFATGLTVSGLPAGTNYFIVKTTTEAHSSNPYNLTSLPTGEVTANVSEAPSLVVTTSSDVVNPFDGLTSLREAISFANNNSGADTITFASNVAGGTIVLNGTELTLRDTALTTIDGGTAGITIDGNNASQVLEISGAQAALTRLTVTRGGSVIGGIFNNGTLTITSSTVSGNTATSFAGGILNNGTLTVINSTVSGNTATGFAGGILNNGTLTVINSTISGNTATSSNSFAGGIQNNGILSLNNSLLLGNSASFAPDLTRSFSGSHNLIGVPNGFTLGQVIAVDPNDPTKPLLANNGGPTKTIALVPGSPALNAGSNALAVDASNQPLSTDQRGTGFNRIVGGTVDIGAFESQAVAPKVVSFQVLYGNGKSYTLTGATPRILPWQITGIRVVFSEAVTGNAASLSGVSVSSLSGSGTNTLIWTLTSPLVNANLTAVLQASGLNMIQSLDGLALDGNGDSTGGDNFSQQFRVLYGDVNGDGFVNSTDASLVRARMLGQTVAVPDFFLDVNGDGVVDANDFNIVRNRSGQKLI